MNPVEILRMVAGLGAGAVIGYAFGVLQNAALRRNEQRAQLGELKSGWNLMPGSGVRIAYLLIALLLVQVVCPLIFVGNTQWVVSAGVVAGYGSMLVVQLRHRLRLAAR
jgi:hypothetical protein